MDFLFILNSIFLGIGLAMDAFSVSLANGLNDKSMKKTKIFFIAGLFAFFQALMPMIGWICIHYLLSFFNSIEKFIPWIALILLVFIGTKMILDSQKNKQEDCSSLKIGLMSLIIQAIATSIDALSVGFTFAEYDIFMVLVAIALIALVTFLICFCGVVIGKKIGTKLSNNANLLGGIILILIGAEIFITSII